jgi:hypothetical protein
MKTLKPSSRIVVLSFVLLIWLVFEGVSLLELIFYPTPAIEQPTVAGLEHDLFLSLAPFSPILLLGILYSCWIRVGLLVGIRRSSSVRSTVQRFSDALGLLSRELGSSAARRTILGLNSRFFLLASLALAGFVAYFPYRPDLNANGAPVGFDVRLYINWVSQMVSKTPADALRYSFTGPGPSSRPLLLISLYLASSLLSIQPDLLVKALPVFLAMGFVASSYLLVRLGSGNHQMAALTAILTAGSTAITVGIWASYYANWLALIEAYTFLGVLLSSVKSPSSHKRVVMVTLTLALLFTHPWTWILMMAVAGGFIASHWKTAEFRPLLVSFAGLFLVNIVIESVKTFALSAFGVPAAGQYIVGQTPDPFGNILAIWPNTIDGIMLTYSGLLATAIMLGLALLYTLKLRYGDDFQRLLLLWILVASVPFSFLSGYFQTRIIYDMPIPVLAAGGLMMAMPRAESRGALRLFLLVAVVLLNASYALQSMLIV